MKITDLLATSLNRRDDKPNQELAVEIIKSKRHDWVKQLVDNLHHKDNNIQSDCIKVLYEIGERGAADMIAPYYIDFGQILKSNNNRLVWGAMTALDMIALIDPEGIYGLLPMIMSAVDNGSVITIDHGVGVLSKLASQKKYSDSVFPLLMEQLKKCPPKQLPMYAEKAMIAINTRNKYQFINLIETRLSEMEKESQKARLRKIIKKLNDKK